MPIDTYTPERLKYLALLGEQFPNFQALCTEIINLGAILNLVPSSIHASPPPMYTAVAALGSAEGVKAFSARH